MKLKMNWIAAVTVIVTIIFAQMLPTQSFAQEKDTTKIRMGKKKILIIEDENDRKKSKEKLEQGKLEFKAELEALETKLKGLQDEIKIAIDSVMRKQLNQQLEDLEKQRAAIEKGLRGIEDELANKDKEEIEIEENIEIETPDMEIPDNDDIENHFKGDKGKFKGHWSGLDIGLNNFVNASGSLSLDDEAKFMELNTSKSWAVDLNFLQYSIPLFSKYVGLVTGMGFQLNNFRLDGNYQIEQDANGVIIGTIPTDRTLQKSTLNMNYLTAPLIFEFQIPAGKKDKRIHIGVGVTGGVKIGSKTKQVWSGDKRKTKGDYQLSPFRYGLTARVGYKHLNLFANYSLVPLFEKEKGPELYPFAIGISLF